MNSCSTQIIGGATQARFFPFGAVDDHGSSSSRIRVSISAADFRKNNARSDTSSKYQLEGLNVSRVIDPFTTSDVFAVD